MLRKDEHMKAVNFISPLSEIEVRMTLKELCGSKFDNYPFCGEVNQSSFSFRRNGFFRGVERYVILNGVFCEKNGKTHVTVSPSKSRFDTVSGTIFNLVFLAFAIFGFILGLNDGFIQACVLFAIILGFGWGYSALFNYLFSKSFNSSVDKIKKALKSI